MNTQLLTKLLQRLDEPAAQYDRLNKYYAGEQPLAFLSPEARTALGNRMTTLSANIPRLLVEAVAERLRITGFSNAQVWNDWLANDLDQMSGICHREALILGASYVIVWGDGKGGSRVTVESARQVSVITDPATRKVVAALKRWETDKTTEAVLYEPNTITRLRAQQTGASVAGFQTVEVIKNPLGVVPVVRFRNASRLLDQGQSEMTDVLSLTDALVKLTGDMMVASEYVARPRRWATGLELEEEDVLDDEGNPTGETEAVNPYDNESDRMMINEAPEGKFGQLPGSDLAAYDKAIGVIMRQISAVSGLPEHMLGIGGDNPTSADSIRASEAALTARAEARQRMFGRQWENVARLMVATRTGVDPAGVDVSVQWADPATRSVAQEADAVTKLVQAGVLPVTYALKKLGYSDDEIADIRLAKRADALDTAGTDIGALL